MGLNLPFNKKMEMLNTDVDVRAEATSIQGKIEEKTNEFLQSLESEEANLMSEKQALLGLREKLQSKLQKKIRSKKMGNKRLRAEIAGLKIECEKLSLSVRVSRHFQNLERASKKTFRQTMKDKGYSEKAIEEIWKWYDYISNV